MADVIELLDHVSEVRPPPLGQLVRVAERRRRRAAVGATVGTAAAVVAIALAVQPFAARDAAPVPIAPSPSPTRTTPPARGFTPPPPDAVQGPFPSLTPEEIRNHPDAVDVGNHHPVTAARGVRAREWGVCLADCTRATQHQVGEYQSAIEVTSDGFRSSTLYPFTGDESFSHVIDEWFFHRTELVDGRGRSRAVRIGTPLPVTEIGGPVFYARGGAAWLDLDTMQVHEVEGTYWDWGGASDTWYWGSVFRVPESVVLEQGVVWRMPDGSFGVHLLPFDATDWSTQMLASGTPGTMGVIEPGPPRLLHVSTDFGRTWDVRVMPDDWGTGTFLPDDWRTWVDVWPTWPSS